MLWPGLRNELDRKKTLAITIYYVFKCKTENYIGGHGWLMIHTGDAITLR